MSTNSSGTEQPNPEAPTPPRKGLGRVHIYGGGITGLTAAHELARRGFRVRVHEPAHEYDETGRHEGGLGGPALGGMARTQFLRVPKGAWGNFHRRGECDTFRLVYQSSPDFKPTEGETIDKESLVRNFLGVSGFFSTTSPGILHIRIPTPPGTSVETYPIPEVYMKRRETALAVKRYVSRAEIDDPIVSPSPHLAEDRVVLVDLSEEKFARGADTPFPPLKDGDALELEVMHYLPGEHGFRFFPSYYRHLFSTLVEIPLLDEGGRLTGRRVFDNLVPSSFYGIAARGRRIRFLRRAPATRPVELLQELQDLASSGYPPTDTLQFTLRIWRYLCTCPERRKADYEKVSWWEYLEGFDPSTKTRRYEYSAAFKKDMQFAPRVLAAFDGAWGDARTNGNTLAQLYLNNLLPLPKTDGTLNGPTTQAWFRPWRRYLAQRLGVEFTDKELSRLELDDEGHLVPYVCNRHIDTGPGPCLEIEDTFGTDEFGTTEPVDYFIVATDAATAERLTEKLPRLGVIDGLRGFTTVIPPNPRGLEKEQPRPGKGVLPGHVPWDRFQTLTGIQFFFPNSVRLAEGYLYFLDAPWGLSAINSHQYWDASPSFAQAGFASVLSVDIGNWYVHEPGVPSPSSTSRHEIAHEVWNQIREATLQHHAPISHARQSGFALPDPAWYHVDRYLRFDTDPATDQERAVENRAPYLIPIVGDWERRPGPEPWDPLAPAPATRPEVKRPNSLWQAPHGGYPVHWDTLVFAGTYLKTFSRMTTMESANESARHAVNAIIDHYLAHRDLPGAIPPSREASSRGIVPTVGEYSGGTLTGSPDLRMTPIGEYCRIWDPERHELAELAPLRELDAKLFAAGLPHVWDVLHLEPQVLPLLSLDPTRGAESLKSFLSTLRLNMETL